MSRTHTRRVAIVWRGDRHTRDKATATNNRLKAIFAALAAEGFAPEPAVYAEDFADEVRTQLLDVAAALIFVDPVSGGARRQALDALLRDVAARNVLVSAHPDVIAKLGVKAVLHTTRALGWGTDTHMYTTATDFRG